MKSSSARLAVVYLAVAIWLSACTEKVEVCGGTGTCCGVAYSSNQSGQLTPDWFQCVQSCTQCPPQNLTGSPVCPITSPPSGACSRKSKTRWIWDSEYWDDNSSKLVAALHTVGVFAAKQSTKDVVTAEGKRLSYKDAQFCVQQCELSDGISFCPRVEIPNDPSAGVLSLLVDIAEGPIDATRTIPISDVISRFNVAAGLGDCQRGDVVVDKGKALNLGAACDASVSGGAAGVRVDAALVTSPQITSDVASVKGAALFSPQVDNFALKLADRTANAKFGGPIVIAARTRKMEIAAAVDGSKGRVCVALIPSVAARSGLYSIARTVNRRPNSLTAALTYLKSVTPPQGNHALQAAQLSGQSEFPNFFPLSRNYATGIEKDVAFAAKVTTYKPARPEPSSRPISIADALLVADVIRCGATVRGRSAADLASLLPRGSGDGPLTSDVRGIREQRAGDLILCRYGSELFSDAVRSEIDQLLPVAK